MRRLLRPLAEIAVAVGTGVAVLAIGTGAMPLVIIRAAEMAESWLELERWRNG